MENNTATETNETIVIGSTSAVRYLPCTDFVEHFDEEEEQEEEWGSDDSRDDYGMGAEFERYEP